MKYKKVRKHIISLVLTTVLAITSSPMIPMDVRADDQEPIAYCYYESPEDAIEMSPTVGQCTEYTKLQSIESPVPSPPNQWGQTGGNSWYVATEDVNISPRVTVLGTVNLIVCDGVHLKILGGITVASDNKLNIYGQNEGTGLFEVGLTCGDGNAGIGGDSDTPNAGEITIHGTEISAHGGYGAAGIGGGINGIGGNITIYQGTVNAYGGAGGSGIGANGSGSAALQVYGNENVYAHGGAGSYTEGETATPGGAGIRCTIDEVNGSIVITAKGGEGAKNTSDAYMSGGGNGIDGNIRLTGGTNTLPAVHATGGDGVSGGHGIRYGGYFDSEDTLTVTDCTPTIEGTGGNGTSGDGGCGIYSTAHALDVASGTPKITSVGGNSLSGNGGFGLYGNINVQSNTIPYVLAIRGDGTQVDGIYSMSGSLTGINMILVRETDDEPWEPSIPGTDAVTIEDKYAKIADICTVVYEPNEGIGEMDSEFYEVGESITLARNIYTRQNSIFAGWNTAEDGSGTSYADGASVTLPADTGDLDEGRFILYAQWISNHSYKKEVMREPDCTHTGLVRYKCECGQGYIKSIPALGHDLYLKTISQLPTATTEGKAIYACRRCRSTEERSIPILTDEDTGKAMTPRTKTVSVSGVYAGNTVTVRISSTYDSEVTYSGKKLTPKADLQARTDISGLTAQITTKGNYSAGSLFKVSYISGNNQKVCSSNADKAPYYYVKIKLNEAKAKKAGLSKKRITELKAIVKSLNRSLKEQKCYYTINPVELDRDLTVAKIKGKVKSGKVRDISYVKVSAYVNGRRKTFTLSKKNYSIKLLDGSTKRVMITGKGNFSGAKETEMK